MEKITTEEKHDIVLKAIMERYYGLNGCICQLREDADVVYVNIADDINYVIEEDEIEEIINELVT
tara:strand:- start:406 stop:600 length:195 start_codon:yes stop_codon:yes gene_type:complete